MSALSATPSIARIAVARHVAYRAEMTIWILSAILPLIMLALWNAVAEDGAIAGFGQPEMARYFVAALVCRQLTGAWLVWELSFDIRTGHLSPQLLRPVNPIYVHGVTMLMAMPFRIAVLSPLVLAIVAWRPDLFVLPSLLQAALFAPSIALAWLMGFLVQAIIGTSSFWLDRSDGLFGLWFAAWSLLSGYIAPLAFFPEGWQQVLHWLPFRYMLAVPVELLGGFLEPADAAWAIAGQVAWTALFAVVATATWRVGLRRYGAFGG